MLSNATMNIRRDVYILQELVAYCSLHYLTNKIVRIYVNKQLMVFTIRMTVTFAQEDRAGFSVHVQ